MSYLRLYNDQLVNYPSSFLFYTLFLLLTIPFLATSIFCARCSSHVALEFTKKAQKIFRVDTKTKQNLPVSGRVVNNRLEPGFEPGTSCIRSMNDSHYTIRAVCRILCVKSMIFEKISLWRIDAKRPPWCSGVVKENDDESTIVNWELNI